MVAVLIFVQRTAMRGCEVGTGRRRRDCTRRTIRDTKHGDAEDKSHAGAHHRLTPTLWLFMPSEQSVESRRMRIRPRGNARRVGRVVVPSVLCVRCGNGSWPAAVGGGRGDGP